MFKTHSFVSFACCQHLKSECFCDMSV